MKTEYVAGFMFDGDNVALVVKNRPQWQAGKMNGIGGHVEHGESPTDAMVREFREETGYNTAYTQWNHFATLTGTNFIVHFFWTLGNHNLLRTTTDEYIVSVPLKQINCANAIPNLSWLIPMAKSMAYDKTNRFQILEAA